MRKSEAVRLARDYVFAVPGVSRADAAALVVEEFAGEHPKHYDKGKRYVERLPLEAWLLTHRLPLPWRWQWRGRATGIGVNTHGELMVFDPTKRPEPGESWIPFGEAVRDAQAYGITATEDITAPSHTLQTRVPRSGQG